VREPEGDHAASPSRDVFMPLPQSIKPQKGYKTSKGQARVGWGQE
jgi:hypothetical protein